jgi:hypothetical protein
VHSAKRFLQFKIETNLARTFTGGTVAKGSEVKGDELVMK